MNRNLLLITALSFVTLLSVANEERFEPGMAGWTSNKDADGCFSVKDGILSFDYSGAKNAFLSKKIPPVMPGKQVTLSFEGKVMRTGSGGFACVMLTNANWGPSETIILSGGEWKKYSRKITPKVIFDYLIIRSKYSNAFQIRNLRIEQGDEPKKAEGNTLSASSKEGGVFIRTPFALFEILGHGARISSLKLNGMEWVAAGKRPRIQGIGKLWFEGNIPDDTGCDYNLAIQKAPDGTIWVTGKTELPGLEIRKTYRFSTSPVVYMELNIKNTSSEPRRLNYRWHHTLNIGRNPDSKADFRLYYENTVDGVVEYSLTSRCPEELKVANASFYGVVDNAKQALVFSSPEPQNYYSWLSLGTRCGTIETENETRTLAPGAVFSKTVRLHTVSGLSSIGKVADDFIFSLANPEFNAVALQNSGNFSGELAISSGTSYPLRRNGLTAGTLLNIPLSALADPGTRTFFRNGIKTEIPHSLKRFPDASSENQPYPYVPLTFSPMPEAPVNSIRYFPSDHYERRFCVSPDAVTMVAFGQNVNGKFNGSSALHLYLPEGVSIHGGRFVKSVEDCGMVDLKDGKFRHFRIVFSYGTQTSRAGLTELVTSCGKNTQKVPFAYYATETNGVISAPEGVPFEAVRIPEVPKLRKLYTAFWGLHGTLDAFPDTASFARIGLQQPDPAYFNTVIQKGMLQKYKAARNFLRFEAKEEDSFCLDRNGKRNGTLACPTYRGEGFLRLLEEGRKAVDDGVLIHGFDPERTNGREICFCERCRKLFAAENPGIIPQNAGLDEFVKVIDGSQRAGDLWLQFKLKYENDRYGLYREAMRSHLAGKGKNPDAFKILFAAQPGWMNPQRLYNSSLQDPMKLAEIADYFSPMIYIDINGRFRRQSDMREVVRELEAFRKVSNGRLRVFPVLSVGYPYGGFNADIEPGVMKAQILEAFAAGARGFSLYSEGWFDARDMKEVAEAMRLIAQNEDVFDRGETLTETQLKNLNGNTFVSGIAVRSGEAAILVSDYSDREKHAGIFYDCKVPVEVVDAETRQVIAKLSPGKNIFPVVLDQRRIRLFYIRPI